MEKEVKTSDKVYNILKKAIIIIIGITFILFIVGKYFDNQVKKLEAEQANARLPIIHERIDKIIDANPDVYHIETDFEYDGINFIRLYVYDTWFNSTDIQKKRFAGDVRDSVKSILVEEGFIKAKDRVGIYVYTVDGISLAESNMTGEIKLKD